MGDVKLGKTIREARLKLGLTQEQVAKKAGVSTNWYARFERRSVYLLFIFALVF